MNFLKSPFGKKAVSETVEGGAKAGVKGGAGGFLKNIPYVGTIINTIFGFLDFQDRRQDKNKDGKPDQTNLEAGMGAGGGILGTIIGGLVAATIIPEPTSSAIGLVGLSILGGILSIAGYNVGSLIGDELSGLNKRKRNELNQNQDNNDNNVNVEKTTYESVDVSMSMDNRSSDNIVPINTKSNVVSTISDFDESPQVTYLPLGGATDTGVSATAAAGGISSKSPSDFLPNIPSSDFANNSIALSESIYNVVV